MKNLFEYSDILNSPIEAFCCEYPGSYLPIESHWHYFVEVIYLFRGTVNITCNDYTYKLHAGNMILLPPQVLHSIYQDPNEPDFHYACVKFNINRINLVGNYLPNLNNQLRKIAQLENPPLIFTNEDFRHISLSDFFNELVRETSNRYYGYNSFVYSKLSELLIKILRVWYYNGISVETESIAENDDYSLQDVLIYIDSHSHENINIENLAKMCNMSYSYFAKVFRRQYGQSCTQYIEFIRLSRVENLLLFTEMDLSTIASETGFADCSHLIRSFHKRYQITPKQFRLKHKNASLLE